MLSTSEGILYQAFLIRQARIFSDYPIGDEQRKLEKAHKIKEDNLYNQDNTYIKKNWYAPGNEPKERLQKDINEELHLFIKDLLRKRPENFDLMKEVNEFDPIENFKETCNSFLEKE